MDLIGFYQNSVEILGDYPRLLLISKLFFLSIFIVILCLFIWLFYRTISERNIIKLNLNKYNKGSHPVLKKFFAVLFYFLEYIVVIPFFILLWSTAMAVAILLISDRAAADIMFFTTILIISIRILSYFHKEITIELAKLFPLVTLSVFLIYSSSFNAGNVLTKINEVPLLLSNLYIYFLAILGAEIVLRLIHTAVDFWKSEEERLYFDS